MTDILTNLERLTHEVGPDRTSKRRSHRISRRKRSLRSTIKYHLDRMLRPRKVFRTGLVLLALVGFIHVSLMNDVLGPKFESIDSAMNDSSAGSNAKTGEHARFVPGLSIDRPVNAPFDVPTSTSATQQASSMLTGDLESLEHAQGGRINADDLITTDNTASDRGDIEETTTYVVNEGGSLWRTGRRFIEDEVLLDKLIDNLSEKGMNVRSVSAGVEFIVNNFGSNGLSVVVHDGDDIYESRIVKNGVTSSVRTWVDKSRTASLD